MKDLPMDVKSPSDMQEYLDSGAARIRKDIERMGAIADYLCELGQNEASARARMVVMHLNGVLAEGRLLKAETAGGDVIQPRSGGK